MNVTKATTIAAAAPVKATASHTPGPWTTDPELFGKVYCDDATGSIVAQCGDFKYAPRPHDEIEANARLIAAAPELQTALKAASGYMTNAVIDLQTGTKKQTTLDTLNGGLKLVAAAIAKVEGQQP